MAQSEICQVTAQRRESKRLGRQDEALQEGAAQVGALASKKRCWGMHCDELGGETESGMKWVDVLVCVCMFLPTVSCTLEAGKP